MAPAVARRPEVFIIYYSFIPQTLSAEPKNCTCADGASSGQKTKSIYYLFFLHSTRFFSQAFKEHTRGVSA